jgi:8-oxo-dGTP pyrophosphatase MutT (NUDIX family)
MPKSRIRASAVCEAEGHLLLVRLRDPTSNVVAFFPPGGGVENGEAPADTARRETVEETGLSIAIEPQIELIDEYPFRWDGVDYDCTTHYFGAVLESKFEKTIEPVEDAVYNEGAAWVPSEEALEALVVHSRIARAVSRVLGRVRRARWRKDSGFRGHAQMLLLIHDQFRMTSERIRLVHAREPEVDLGWIRRLFEPLAEILHHHHHAEEIVLFPLITERTGTSPTRLVDDHETLKTAIDAVFAAFRTGDVARALADFDDVLVDHLDREEGIAMPVLLAESGK